MDIKVFSPGATTKAVDATDSSSTPLAHGAALLGGQLLFYNEGADDAFAAFGGASVEAAVPADGSPAAGFPIPAGVMTVYTPPEGADYVALICKSGETATVYLTPGSGA